MAVIKRARGAIERKYEVNGERKISAKADINSTVEIKVLGLFFGFLTPLSPNLGEQ